MRQAWHIFRKDVRHLHREIAFLLVLAALSGWFAEAGLHLGADASDAMQLLYVAAVAFTIARLIHGEAIPGETQFWITRPYRWTSLLAAKILFLVVFVHVPVLLMQITVLRLEGFALPTFVSGLAWMQVLICLAITVPCLTLAAMTAGMVPFIGTTLMLLLVGFITFESAWAPTDRSLFFVPETLEWLRYSIPFLAAIALPTVLYLQYRTRRTRLSALIAGAITACGALAFVGLPWPALFAAQSRISKYSFPVEITRYMAKPVRSPIDSDGRMNVSLPLLITGVPDGIRAQIEMFDIHLQRADGRSLALSGSRLGLHRDNESANELVLSGSVYPGRWLLDGPDGQTVTLQLSLYITLFGNKHEQTIPFQTTPVDGPDGLRCFDDEFHEVACRAPFRWPGHWVSVMRPGVPPASFTHLISYSPFPATLQLNPIVEQTAHLPMDRAPAREVTIEVEEPLEYLRRDVVIPNLHLGVR